MGEPEGEVDASTTSNIREMEPSTAVVDDGEKDEVEARREERKRTSKESKRDADASALFADDEDVDANSAPKQTKKGKGKERAPVSPLEQEGDTEKRVAEDVEASSTPKKTKKGKGKRKAKAPALPTERDGDNEERSVKKPGRLSKEAIEQAHALRQTYHDELEALALKEGKSVAALLTAVGDTVLDSRSLNPWNAFQAYATHPEGLAMERQQDQSITEFNSDILAAYRRQRAEAEDVEHAFDEVMEWYRKELDDQTAAMRTHGLTDKQLKKIVKPFNARVSLFIAYSRREIC
jgi:hypothetical protein